MFRLCWIVVALSVIGSPAAAQTVVDGSAGDVPPADLEEVRRILGGQMQDVTGAEIRRLYKASGTHGYCGEVKGRGAYVEWSPFFANIFTNTAWILTKASSPEAYADVRVRVMAFGCLRR